MDELTPAVGNSTMNSADQGLLSGPIASKLAFARETDLRAYSGLFCRVSNNAESIG